MNTVEFYLESREVYRVGANLAIYLFVLMRVEYVGLYLHSRWCLPSVYNYNNNNNNNNNNNVVQKEA